MNILKYDKVNLIAKCDISQNFNIDMMYNATYFDRVNKNSTYLTRYVNFYFNPKPFGDEETYSYLINKILEKNTHMKDFKIKSLEVNFDYETSLDFNQLDLLGKVLATVLSKQNFKKVNINAEINEFNYETDEFKNNITSYKFYKYKSKNARNKFLEIKLYKKNPTIIRFEIIFYNSDNRLFKNLNESYISSGKRIKKTFNSIYNNFLVILNENNNLWENQGISEFINAFCLTLSEENKVSVA